nr:basic transcription factor 3 [Tanacetum cinerariifolium]
MPILLHVLLIRLPRDSYMFLMSRVLLQGCGVTRAGLLVRMRVADIDSLLQLSDSVKHYDYRWKFKKDYTNNLRVTGAGLLVQMRVADAHSPLQLSDSVKHYDYRWKFKKDYMNNLSYNWVVSGPYLSLESQTLGAIHVLHKFVEPKAAVLCVQWCPDNSSVFGSLTDGGDVNIKDYEIMNRKKKAVHKTNTKDDERLQRNLKRIGVQAIPQIKEVNIFRDEIIIQFLKEFTIL